MGIKKNVMFKLGFKINVSNNVSSVVEWRRVRDQHGIGSKPTRAILFLGKDTLRHIPLFGGLGKQF